MSGVLAIMPLCNDTHHACICYSQSTDVLEAASVLRVR